MTAVVSIFNIDFANLTIILYIDGINTTFS